MEGLDSLGSVQQKISCIFETTVLDEQSSKRDQPYRVVATDTIKKKALESDIFNARASEKLDGTCVYITKFADRPWLWARLDRRPNKTAERKFRKFQTQQQKLAVGGGEPDKTTNYPWNPAKDFKETPSNWIPASGVEIKDGVPVPDNIGHTPGWVPVDPSARQHCWHLTAVDLMQGVGLVLREDEDTDTLFVESVPLSQLEGHTAELIGTNINGNPYGLGSKKFPLHFLVIHGTIRIRNAPPLESKTLRDWMTEKAGVEGVVWHCPNSALFKLHRNHLGLHWPVKEPAFSQRPVEIHVEVAELEFEDPNNLFVQFSQYHGHSCTSLRGLEALLQPDTIEKPGENG